MSVAVIINPVSGGARPGTAHSRAAAAAAILERHGETAEVSITERPGHAHDLTQAAVARGARLVIAWGGDGTINEVASALAFGDVPLAIIPAGSGNGLAAELGVDPRPELAIAKAVRATPSRIDLGALGGRLFINLAGIGIDAHVASEFNRPANVGRGFVRYLRLGVAAIVSYA